MTAIGMASRKGTRDHNCDAARIHHGPDGTAATVIDGTGNSPELANLTGVLAEVAVRIGARRGTLAGLITAGDLITDDDHEAAAVLALVPDDGPAVVAWIGDCRAYRWDGTELRQYTTDHTMGQQLRASGGAPIELAATHDHWLMIGLSGATAATVRQVWVPDHDQNLDGVLLLTSDGVHDQVPYDRLVDLLREHTDPQALADAIVAVAIADKDGYCDDATVVVIRGRSEATSTG